MTRPALALGLGLTLALAAALLPGAGVTAAEATNPAVKARQAAMSAIGANTKILGDMAGGKTAFDADKAAAAAAALSGTAVTVADLFRPQEDDPESEAKPEIWANFADFEAKADALYQASMAIDTSSPESIGAGMGALGGACKACHGPYRE